MNVPAVEDHCTVCGDKNVFTMRYMMDIWEAAHSATHPNATVTYRRRGDPERLPDSGYNEVSLAQTDLSAPYEYDSIVPPFGDTIGLVQAGFDRCLVGRESWEIRDRCNDSILRLLAPGPGAQTIYGFIELNDD